LARAIVLGYLLAVMPLRTTLLLVAGLSAFGLACSDHGGDENTKICLPADDFDSNYVSWLFEPCAGDLALKSFCSD